MSSSILNYRQFGESGAPLIAIHGLFGSLENLGMVTRQLAINYRVYAIDLPNHGSSSHSDCMTMVFMCEVIRQWMDAVGIASAHFIGHSLGGKVCMEMSLMFPSMVNSLIIADIAPVSYPPRHHDVFTALRAVDLATINGRSQADQQMKAHVSDSATRSFLLKNLVKADGRWQWRMNLDSIETNYSQLLTENSSDRPPYQNEALFIKGENSDYLLPVYRQHILKRFRILATGYTLKNPTFLSALLDGF
jgi:esterase